MGIRSRRWAKAWAYSYLLRSQPGPLQDEDIASRMLKTHASVIKLELWRMGINIDIPTQETSDEEAAASEVV